MLTFIEEACKKFHMHFKDLFIRMNPSIYYHSMALRKDLRSKIGENLK